MVSKIKLKPKGTPPYWDGKGYFRNPEHPNCAWYYNLELKVGNALLRFPKKKTPFNSPFGYYRDNSYFPGYHVLRR